MVDVGSRQGADLYSKTMLPRYHLYGLECAGWWEEVLIEAVLIGVKHREVCQPRAECEPYVLFRPSLLIIRKLTTAIFVANIDFAFSLQGPHHVAFKRRIRPAHEHRETAQIRKLCFLYTEHVA